MMIRILHFADLHLGVENYGKVDPQTGLSSRVRDFLNRLDEVVDFALREKVDLVVFAGDAFRDRHPEPTYQRDFARRIARLAQKGVAVVLVAGNHDLPSMLVKATSMDIFRALEVKNVYVSARQEEVLPIRLKRGRVLQVATFPYVNRNRLLLSDEVRRRPLREQEEYLRTQIAQRLVHLADQVDRSVPAVFVGHLTVLGAELGSEQRMVLGSQPEALLGAVANPAYDAVLLGHVHRAQVVRPEAPPVLYAGSLERVDFGDEGLEKGFYLVEIDEERRQASYRFVTLPAREFLTLEVDARRGEPMAMARRTIAGARQSGRLAGAVVRLHLQVRLEDAGQVDAAALRKEMDEAFFVAGIAVDVERSDRVVFRGELERLAPMEALERYWIARGVSAARREVLLQHLRQVMEEGEAQ